MQKIKSALISVFYKDGLEPILQELNQLGITIYSTGGTLDFIEKSGFSCQPVETLTQYPAILGGRVKTLHPCVFGGILGKRDDGRHLEEMDKYNIPQIDLVIVDLYPFSETVKQTNDESLIIEKIDIGGPSMIRAAAKNHKDVLVVADKKDYPSLLEILQSQQGKTNYEQRRQYAIKAFDICTQYDTAISAYFHKTNINSPFGNIKKILRYGENPQQQASFIGNLDELFLQLNGKELSYNNLVDTDAALQLIKEFEADEQAVFAIIKHTNVCGVAKRNTVKEAWDAALAGDPESSFGGVLVCNKPIDEETASSIHELFFEVLIAPAFDAKALNILNQKKNRIVLQIKNYPMQQEQYKSLLGGILLQQADDKNYEQWKETGGRESTEDEKRDLVFCNIICKHLKSNAIALVKNNQLLGKGCGQTSRIDALKQAIEKAAQFGASLQGAVLASDAFFPFDDCVTIAHKAGITAYIQPGGSIRDKDSINYCQQHNLAMVLTSTRHFKH